jgi:hypothetical protein
LSGDDLFGVGAANPADRIEMRRPNSRVTTREHVSLRQVVIIRD